LHARSSSKLPTLSTPKNILEKPSF
jgi:hypothetical protein